MSNVLKNARLMSDQVLKLNMKLDHIEANYKRLRLALKKIGKRNGTCWCYPHPENPVVDLSHIIHTETCDAIYVALYSAERGE